MSATERTRFAVAVLAGAFALGAWVVPSWAEERAPTAQSLFDAAVRSMEGGRYEEACPKLEASDHLEASGGTALNLGYCYEHLGKWARAYDAYLLAVAHYEASGKPDRRKVALDHADAIRDRVTLVRLAGTRPEDVRDVTIDGEPRAFRDGVVTVDRGDHTIGFSAGGVARTIPFVASGTDVSLVVPEVVAQPPPPGPIVLGPMPPPPPPHVETPVTLGAGRRTAAWVVGGVGLALLTGAIVTGALALNREAASDAECPNGRCSVAGVDAHATAQSLAITTDVLVITTVVALGVSTFLFLTSKPAKSAAFAPLVVRF